MADISKASTARNPSSSGMSENPYSPSKIEANPGDATGMPVGAVFREFLKYLGAYLLGIIASIALTPVDMNLAGAPLWFFYPILAPIGFLLFYLYLEGAYLPLGGKGLSYWLYFSIGFVPVLMEVLAYMTGSPRLRQWRPLWIGFPIGFVGALGVYYTAAASI